MKAIQNVSNGSFQDAVKGSRKDVGSESCLDLDSGSSKNGGSESCLQYCRCMQEKLDEI